MLWQDEISVSQASFVEFVQLGTRQLAVTLKKSPIVHLVHAVHLNFFPAGVAG